MHKHTTTMSGTETRTEQRSVWGRPALGALASVGIIAGVLSLAPSASSVGSADNEVGIAEAAPEAEILEAIVVVRDLSEVPGAVAQD